MSRGECSFLLVTLGPHTINPSAWANSTNGEMTGNLCSAERHPGFSVPPGALLLRPFGVPSHISCGPPHFLR